VVHSILECFFYISGLRQNRTSFYEVGMDSSKWKRSPKRDGYFAIATVPLIDKTFTALLSTIHPLKLKKRYKDIFARLYIAC